MAAMFSPPSLPAIPPAPVVPTISTPDVTQAANDAVAKQALAKGRASTVLTNPSDQRAPDLSRQRYLGMA